MAHYARSAANTKEAQKAIKLISTIIVVFDVEPSLKAFNVLKVNKFLAQNLESN